MYLSYDEMLEEKITSDRQVRIACEILWATVSVAWTGGQRQPSAPGLLQELHSVQVRQMTGEATGTSG